MVTSLCMMVGFWQLGLYVVGFGRLTWLFSPVLMSGYTCGASMHTFTSQLKGLFGVDVPRHSGPLKLVYVGSDDA